MIKFFGSLPFAIFLIVTTLLFVIAGTFLESYTESHLFAAKLTYGNPIFKILLWLYFVNILFSALRRYPFKKKHIPFLMTHLGLLLLLFGVFVKNHFGVQGACALSEGSGSSLIFLPNTYALQIESKSSLALIKLNNNQKGEIHSDQDLTLTLLEWRPHAEEVIEGFFKGDFVHIHGLAPFKVGSKESPVNQKSHYDIYAYRVDKMEKVDFPSKPSLFFIQDENKKEHLIAFNEKGERFEQALNEDLLYVYNKGYGGYGKAFELPSHFPPMELSTPLTRSWKILNAPIKKEEAVPLIRLLASSQNHSEIVTLHFDKYGQHFKWPILGGKYLIRFQSLLQTIPYHLRLRFAEQINYPGTDQPYSYEASLLINNEEVLLSMNHVFDKKGYRFYLANLITPPTGAKRVQIVINYDPAKYWFTYPGALILVIGILLLYLEKRYFTP